MDAFDCHPNCDAVFGIRCLSLSCCVVEFIIGKTHDLSLHVSVCAARLKIAHHAVFTPRSNWYASCQVLLAFFCCKCMRYLWEHWLTYQHNFLLVSVFRLFCHGHSQVLCKETRHDKLSHDLVLTATLHRHVNIKRCACSLPKSRTPLYPNHVTVCSSRHHGIALGQREMK